MTTQMISVRGMTCEHCVASVTEELTELDGVSNVDVELVPGDTSHVTVTSDAPLDASAIESAIAEAGYELAR